ncbi:hypothetical protein BRX36_10855 [Sphingomonas sp. S-NIH.Pt1_0416]|uniref:hypothetical protein n=1 Tax=Sphingomonas sp. S-NIH.Pt1_0416 TaxID=1920123 RepID=UPI000F7DE6D8|nr:hypothetical protein [Sphingomonas sp. S-NIH.Pt1_0416]RSU65279.1 hypothetical protein BRX36_10855 [Sphingomonas sp. S-NIH.Pt1_0416]
MLKPLFAAALLALPGLAFAQGPVLYPHAQALADGIVKRNPDMLDVILHVSPTPEAKNIVIAAHLTKANGEASGDDNLGVAATGAPLVEVQKDGVRLGILVQLRDARHRPIGAIGLMYPYKPGDNVEAAVRRSFAIRDELAARIPSRAVLVG